MHWGLIPHWAADRFGKKHVFRDLDTITAGEDFVETVRQKIHTSDIVLALIGPRRLTAADEEGREAELRNTNIEAYSSTFQSQRRILNIDEDVARWRWCWLPDGRCDSFTKGAILLFAPPTSGVYGLYNFDCQVFIGESANIQEALLRHESEPDFQSQHLQPTGFTFEPCAAELRKSKADELIARFHPVLQTEAALTKTWSAPNSARVSEAGLGGREETYSDHHEFPLHESESNRKFDSISTSSGRVVPR